MERKAYNKGSEIVVLTVLGSDKYEGKSLKYLLERRNFLFLKCYMECVHRLPDYTRGKSMLKLNLL